MENPKALMVLFAGLNPYYNGRYSWRRLTNLSKVFVSVLILIIMEDTHGATKESVNGVKNVVLILIIMEDTHGETTNWLTEEQSLAS